MKDVISHYINDLPAGWMINPFKYHIDFQEGPGIMADDFQDFGVPLLRISNIQSNRVVLEGCNFLDKEKVQKKWNHFKLRKKDYLISSSASTGMISEVTEKSEGAIAYTGIIRLRPKETVYREYIPWILSSLLFSTQIDLMKTGSTIQHFGPLHLRMMSITVPPLETQKQIADFLDRETTRIDTLISKKQKQIELLQEKRQAIITRAVTKGLDPDVKMKDSGVEWIGEIPEHWEVYPIFFLFNENKKKNIGNIEQNLLSLSYGSIIRKDIDTTFGLLPESFETYQIVTAGSIILRLTDLQNDKRSLRVGLAKEKGIITSAYVGLNPKSNIQSSYFYNLLHSYDICKVFYNLGGGLRQTLKFSELKKLPVLLPPEKEQVEIINKLEKEVNRNNQLVLKVKKSISLLREYRSSLISHAVSGQIEVSKMQEKKP